MRRFGLAITLAMNTIWVGQPAQADCLVIDQLDKLHTLQSRLARDPDTALFANDIRQLRVISRSLANGDAVGAVDGNSFTGPGADIVRFLENTKTLLQRASLHDPQSVRPHFTRSVRNNLQEVATHLTALRCNDTQIAVDTATASQEGTSGGDRDAEDLAEVAETLSAIAEEVFQLRSLAIVIAIGVITSITAPIIKRWIVLRRRRAKRHNTTYAMQYLWNDRTIPGVLIDINCHGTKLRHEKDNPIPIGENIKLQICGEWSTGTVMWSNAHYSGVQFNRIIGLTEVKTICTQSEQIKRASQTRNGAPKDAA